MNYSRAYFVILVIHKLVVLASFRTHTISFRYFRAPKIFKTSKTQDFLCCPNRAFVSITLFIPLFSKDAHIAVNISKFGVCHSGNSVCKLKTLGLNVINRSRSHRSLFSFLFACFFFASGK